jgi:hypothetical protein
LVDGVFIVAAVDKKSEGIPPVSPGTYYIVPAYVRAAFPERKDLVSPAIQVKDKDGNVIKCKMLEANP